MMQLIAYCQLAQWLNPKRIDQREVPGWEMGDLTLDLFDSSGASNAAAPFNSLSDQQSSPTHPFERAPAGGCGLANVVGIASLRCVPPVARWAICKILHIGSTSCVWR